MDCPQGAGYVRDAPNPPLPEDTAMATPTLDELTEKVEHLARECAGLRRQARIGKLAGLAVLMGAVALVAGGAMQEDGSKTVEAERFVVKSKDGTVKASLGIGRGGGPELRLNGSDGKPRVTMDVVELKSDEFQDPPHLRFKDSNGKDLVSMGVLPTGGAVMEVTSPDRKAAVALHVTKLGYPQLSVGNPLQPGITLTSLPDSSSIEVLSKTGKPRVLVGNDKSDAPVIQYQRGNGAPLKLPLPRD
jgi:hypothetical protein